ncbi:MAG: hypothetical protein CVU38_11895 [Chloroflexi bacterium HGW-Chloroflexi-1]|nr:MAG: hypothetical protein CVU38_11895 [Chloroflexi bacterium HGW-Chloroflexi-1]
MTCDQLPFNIYSAIVPLIRMLVSTTIRRAAHSANLEYSRVNIGHNFIFAGSPIGSSNEAHDLGKLLASLATKTVLAIHLGAQQAP